MAEELETQAGAVETGDSQESAQPTSPAAKERQPKQETVSLENFRKFQAAKDREAALAIQRAQQAEGRVQRLEEQIHNLSIRDLPEDEQRVAQLQRAFQQEQAARVEAQNYAAYLQQQQQNNQKIDAALAEVVATTGFPLEEARQVFMETNDADKVWKAAFHHANDGRRKRKTDDDDDDPGVQRAKANRVDTGTGKATPNDRSALIRKAIADKDADSYYRAMLAKK
jgi:hypothetical protein